MVNSLSWYQIKENALFIHVYLQPRASCDEIIGLHGDCLKIRLTTPPVEGRANQHLCRFLADFFQVARHKVSVVKGEMNRKKWVRIEGGDISRIGFLEKKPKVMKQL